MPQGVYIRTTSNRKYMNDVGESTDALSVVATGAIRSLPGAILTRQRREAHDLLAEKEQKIFDGRQMELMGKFEQLQEIWDVLTIEWDDSGVRRPLWQVDHETLEDWLGHMEARNVRFASQTTFRAKIEQIKKYHAFCNDIVLSLKAAAEMPGAIEALQAGGAVEFTGSGNGMEREFTAVVTDLGRKIIGDRTPAEYVADLTGQTPERARQEIYEAVGRVYAHCENIWPSAGPRAVPFMADLNECPIYSASMRMHRGTEVDPEPVVVAVVFKPGTSQELINLTLKKLKSSWRSQ